MGWVRIERPACRRIWKVFDGSQSKGSRNSQPLNGQPGFDHARRATTPTAYQNADNGLVEDDQNVVVVVVGQGTRREYRILATVCRPLFMFASTVSKKGRRSTRRSLTISTNFQVSIVPARKSTFRYLAKILRNRPCVQTGREIDARRW